MLLEINLDYELTVVVPVLVIFLHTLRLPGGNTINRCIDEIINKHYKSEAELFTNESLI